MELITVLKTQEMHMLNGLINFIINHEKTNTWLTFIKEEAKCLVVH